MNEFNPYAAPVAEILEGPYTHSTVGLWRDGDILVMSKDAELPNQCLKCNGPTNGRRLKRQLSWHPQGYYLIVLFNLLVYILVAMVVRKTAKVLIPICELHRRRRIRAIALGWLLSLGGIAVIIGGATSGTARNETASGVILAIGFVMIVVGLVYGMAGSRVCTVHKIDKSFVYFRKVKPEFLNTLPDWDPLSSLKR